MEGTLEKDCTVLGGLFQQIITDLKNGTPLWEDFICKATKLQTCLRATIQAIAVYLDAFQKIADAATNTRGATKEIGTALTRICLRHRAVEAKMRTFTSAIMDCLVAPLQEKLEDWKKSVASLDKEHAREYKKARSELKKRSTDTLRMQKKLRKGVKSEELQKAMQDVTDKRATLEEAEKKALKAALVEERSRYCQFVTFLKPVVDEEVSMLSELSHLQEAMDQLEKHTADPYSLPPASEQVIADLKGTDASWTFQSPSGSSPSSIGSRKSSMCSISSMNSSSSGSSKSHHSPNHLCWNRTASQPQYRLCSISSQDSGFTSQDTLCIRNSMASYFQQQVSDMLEDPNTPGTPTATWPNLQDTLQFEKAATAIMNDRPHTISSAYERGHSRPALSVYTFHTPENSHSQPSTPLNVTLTSADNDLTPVSSQAAYTTSTPECTASSQSIGNRPPVPQRGSSLERPSVPNKSGTSSSYTVTASASAFVTTALQPTYVNMNELANMAAAKAESAFANNRDLGVPSASHHEKHNECVEKESSTSESSLESSSGYGSQSAISVATPTPDHDSGQIAEDTCNNNSNSGTRYATVAQHVTENHYYNPDHIIRQQQQKSSFVTASGYCTIKSGTLSRRGSVQTQKPPPPIRRTSSILTSAKPPVSQNSSNSNSLENLPPPPAFLLEGTNTPNSSENGSRLRFADTNCVSSNSDTTDTADVIAKKNAANSIAAEIQKRNSINTVEQFKTQKPNGEYRHRKTSFTTIYSSTQNTLVGDKLDKKFETGSTISVAETVRTLTEMNHQPASPVLVRRAHSNRSLSADRRQESSLIASLSAKIAPTLSPRHSRKYQDPNKTIPRANKVRQWIALRTVADPAVCHDSLMDQIKRGTHLRPTGIINDRSAPRTN